MVRRVALVYGVLYTLVGVLGFLPFLGGSYQIASNNLLGIFPINLVHNFVHLVIGLSALALMGSEASARAYAKWLGVVLVAVGVVGIFWSSPFGILPIGGIDIALHVGTGAVLAYFGFSSPMTVRRAIA